MERAQIYFETILNRDKIKMDFLLTLYLQFIPNKRTSNNKKRSPDKQEETPSERRDLRLQDSSLQEMVDPGMCMSMHQPWASLLVSGIKQ